MPSESPRLDFRPNIAQIVEQESNRILGVGTAQLHLVRDETRRRAGHAARKKFYVISKNSESNLLPPFGRETPLRGRP